MTRDTHKFVALLIDAFGAIEWLNTLDGPEVDPRWSAVHGMSVLSYERQMLKRKPLKNSEVVDIYYE